MEEQITILSVQLTLTEIDDCVPALFTYPLTAVASSSLLADKKTDMKSIIAGLYIASVC